jgi:hypothetical protein
LARELYTACTVTPRSGHAEAQVGLAVAGSGSPPGSISFGNAPVEHWFEADGQTKRPTTNAADQVTQGVSAMNGEAFAGRGVGARFVAAFVMTAAVAGPLRLGNVSSASAQDQNGHVTVCHHTQSRGHPFVTIRVSVRAAAVDLLHGDALGPCAPATTGSTGPAGPAGQGGNSPGRSGNNGHG